MENREVSETATLNMRAVVKETGLKPDTLRAWERRYGLPQPKRTSGGHRLYSQHDLEILKWLITRQKEGLSISRASALWHQLEKDGQNPLQSLPYTTAQTIMATIGGSTIDGLRDEWTNACMRFDEQASDLILTRAFGMFPPESVCFQVLMNTLAEIGAGWYAGEISVQQEHFASELAMRRVEALLAASPPPTLPGRVLILCAPEEEHTFSALLLTYLLRRGGRDASFMGANVPFQRLDQMLSKITPDIVFLIAHQLHTAANLLAVASFLREVNIQIAYGGRIFNLVPEIRERIPGHFLGEEMEQVPETVARLLKHPSSPPEAHSLTIEYQETIERFQGLVGNIETELYSELGTNRLNSAHLDTVNTNLRRNIPASLRLGDISFLRSEFDWIHGLLNNHNISTGLLEEYIKSYAGVLDNFGDQESRIISNYLSSLKFQAEGVGSP